jgi:predicted Zn-dependent protease
MAIESVRARAAALMIVVSVSAASLVAQTVVKPPKNRYTPKQDVQLGKEAAAEIREQYPLIEEPQIARYLARLGERLVAAAPASLKEPVYEYSFTPVNLKEINAFALPGGPMFVNRGMFDAAGSEGEVVGVMAHELSHVLLRHGTANMSKARNPWLQLGQIAGVVGGAVVGGAAGYDPRALARMFETIERESRSSGGSGPQWMSSHPNPGNRTQYITREAEGLAIANAADQNEFAPAKAAFAALPPAKSMRDLEKSKRSSRGGEPASR